MRTLVVGAGGREHALTWALRRSSHVDAVFCAPGNGGTAVVGRNESIAVEDIEALASFAREQRIDLTVVGPEAPLIAGIVDRFEREGLRCFGPGVTAARLEGSKVFAKEFMRRHGIPTANFEVFDDAAAARHHVEGRPAPVVVKADGLAAGKGVYVATTREDAFKAIEEIMVQKKFGPAGDKVVIEDCLEGSELSVHAVCSGGRALLLPGSQDHKRAYDGDRGPNTGGMGAIAPVPSFDGDQRERVYQEIIAPTLEGLAAEGVEYRGVLYAGLMRTPEGPKVLEYNVRFGDPETQVLLPLVDGDVFSLLYGAANGELPADVTVHPDRHAATIVMAASGYPGSYKKGYAITGTENVETSNRTVFHAGTTFDGNSLVTSGGRVLAVTAWGRSLQAALDSAYDGVGQIDFEGACWRKDIGHRALVSG